VWNEVKIRAIDDHCFAVIDERTGAVMEEIEEKKAFFTDFRRRGVHAAGEDVPRQ